ncbi:hypothetical protein [Mycobacterium sp. IEC1808]|uniref:hypothetical protein n=1 Tax=Mycobacterium sp. IEC1808 TaxID=1743230 RepID=UPI0013022FD5|nr:hypothetical protein [Mycobacterium sp. IEC1808]
MKLTRTNFRARVKIADGRRIFISYGLVTFECTAAEALELGHALADAVEQVQRGGVG